MSVLGGTGVFKYFFYFSTDFSSLMIPSNSMFFFPEFSTIINLYLSRYQDNSFKHRKCYILALREEINFPFLYQVTWENTTYFHLYKA